MDQCAPRLGCGPGAPSCSLQPRSLQRRFWAQVHGAPSSHWGAQRGAAWVLLCVLMSLPLREAQGLSQVRSLGHLLAGALSTALKFPQVQSTTWGDPRAPLPRPAALPTFAFCPALTLDLDVRSSCTNLPTLRNVAFQPAQCL